MRFLIKGGRVIDPAQGLDEVTDIVVSDGKIEAIGVSDEARGKFDSDSIVDASGQWVMPGLVDLCARVLDPGCGYVGHLETEIQAALAGGVTSLICPPDTCPILDEPGLIEMLRFRAQHLNRTRVYPLGALTTGLAGEEITEMAELAHVGCVGFSQAESPVYDTRVLMRAMQYAKSFDFTVYLRPVEPHLSRGGVAHSGAYATRMGLCGVPVVAETIALQRHFELVRATGVRLHVCRLSSAKGVEMIRQAKSEGLPVTCDVGIHHLHLIDLDIGFFDSRAHLVPPLREQRDRDALRQGLLDGTIDAICSDHNPVDDDAKLLPFAESKPGATGLELLLALAAKWAHESEASPVRLAQWLSFNPAHIANIQAGQLAVGHTADIVLFDPNYDWVVRPESLNSIGKHTPLLGYSLHGKVTTTICDGRRVSFD